MSIFVTCFKQQRISRLLKDINCNEDWIQVDNNLITFTFTNLMTTQVRYMHISSSISSSNVLIALLRNQRERLLFQYRVYSQQTTYKKRMIQVYNKGECTI